jgi:hypothetical protein
MNDAFMSQLYLMVVGEMDVSSDSAHNFVTNSIMWLSHEY